MYLRLKEKMKEIIKDNDIKDTIVEIKTKVLTPEEAIGNPIDDDYPLLKGKERLLQADFLGSKGVAFTDMYGNHKGTLYEIIDMELKNNFRRAIFISTINAVLKHLKLIDRTEHCRDNAMINCAKRLPEYIKERHKNRRIFQVGFQPRFVDILSRNFELRVTDLDKANIGRTINNIEIEPSEKSVDIIKWCDIIFATGSTFVNNTYKEFIDMGKPAHQFIGGGGKPIIFYGVTCAGPAYLLDLERYCNQ